LSLTPFFGVKPVSGADSGRHFDQQRPAGELIDKMALIIVSDTQGLSRISGWAARPRNQSRISR